MKIVWAFDPQRNPKDSIQTLKEVRFWSHQLKASVLPVCIINDAVLNISPVKVDPKEFKNLTNQVVSKYLSSSAVKGFLTPKILRISSTSKRKKALALAQFAKENGVDMIVLNSHEKASLNPIKLGGFCQALIELTHTPLLVLNPSTRHSQRIEKILFPTEFTRDSKLALKNIIPLAQTFKSKILLFSRVDVSIYYLSGLTTAAAFSNAEDIISEIEAMKKKQAHRWKERLTKLQIPTDTFIQREKRSLELDITNLAQQQKVGLIAIQNRRQPQAERFLGSTARNVLVRAQCPVLILR